MMKSKEKKMFTNQLTIGLPLRTLVKKKQFVEWKYTDSSVKEKIHAQQSVQKYVLTMLWDIKKGNL